MLRILFALIALFCASAFAKDAAPYARALLPAADPSEGEIVHSLRYPLARRVQVELSPTLFYGDKFADSKGLEIDARYFLTERFSVGAGFGAYSSSLSDDLGRLASPARPVIYEPKTVLRLTAGYYPIYGKLLLADRVIRFRMWGEAGPQIALLREVTEEGIIGPQNLPKSFGLYTAIGAWFALSDSFSVHVKGRYSLQSPAIYSGWRRNSTVGIGAGWRFSL